MSIEYGRMSHVTGFALDPTTCAVDPVQFASPDGTSRDAYGREATVGLRLRRGFAALATEPAP